jgi:hypothetical protein
MKRFPLKKTVVSLQVLALILGGAGFLGFALPSAHAASGFINIAGGDISPTQFDGSRGVSITAQVSWGTSDVGPDDFIVVYYSSTEDKVQSLLSASPSQPSGDQSVSLVPHSIPSEQNIYTFNLYSYNKFTDPNNPSNLNSLAQAIATVTPKGSGGGGGGATPTGTLFASPAQCTIPAGASNCSTTIFATANGTTNTRIYFTGPSGQEQQFGDAGACAEGGAGCNANFIFAGSSNVFTLYDYTSGSRGATLASATVTGIQTQVASPTFSISPKNSTIASTGLVQFSATYDPDGASGPQPSQNVAQSAIWSASGGNLSCNATTNGAGGLVSCTNPSASSQNATVSATYNGLSDSATLTILGGSAGGGATPTGTLSANPPSCTIPFGSANCSVTIFATANGTTNTRIYVSTPAGGENPNQFGDAGACAAGGAGCSANFISQSNPATFRLYDYTSGSRGALLATLTVTGSAASGQNPTASLTADGSHAITVDVGHSIHYVWNSTFADRFSSSFTSDDTNCYGPSGTWTVNTASGAQDTAVAACEAGHTYRITYTASQAATGLSQSDTVVVTVRQAAAVGTPSLVIQPPSQNTGSGQSVQFQASYDPDGAAGAQQPQTVTQFATWQITNSGSASCTRPNPGAFICTNPTQTSQTVSISATYNGITALGTIFVAAGSAGGAPTLTVTPAVGNIISGQSLQFTATYDPDGISGPQAPQVVTSIAGWTYTASSGVSCSVGGGTATCTLISGITSPQVVTIIAGYLTVTATASLTVSPTGAVGTPTFIITPTNASVTSGQSFQFSSTYDPDGAAGAQNPQTVTTASTWTYSAPSGVTCSVNAGLATCNSSLPSVQTVTVSASYLGLTSSAVLSVSPSGNTAAQVQTLAATNITQNSATLNGQINPNNNTVSYQFEYGTSPSFGNNTSFQSLSGGSSFQNVSVAISGLAPNTLYYFRLDGQTASGGTVQGATLTFTTGVQSSSGTITVQTLPASGINQTSATLTGSISGNSVTGVVNYRFAYGADAGLSNPSYTGYQSLTLIPSAQNVFMGVYTLSPATTYYYRLDAQLQNGTLVSGSVTSFTTTSNNVQQPYYPPYNPQPYGSAPLVQTQPATVNGGNYAVLNGQVSGNGSSVTYWFEYANNPGLISSITTSFQNAGYSGNYQNVSQSVFGLNPGITYYYRIVGQNNYGTAYGNIYSFIINGTGNSQVQTLPATGITNFSALLNGQLINATPDAQVWFEYGVNSGILSYTTSIANAPGIGTSYGYPYNNGINNNGYNNGAYNNGIYNNGYNNGIYSNNNGIYNNGYNNGNFSQTVSNLQPGVTYYFRAVARSSGGLSSYGQTLSFTAGGAAASSQDPLVTTRQPTSIFQNSALLNGTVNPQGGLSTAWFDYGPGTSLGLHTVQQPVGNGVSDVAYSYALSGLLSNTTYYYQAVAQGPSGNQARGQILSFQTRSSNVTTAVFTPRQVTPAAVVTPTQGYSCLTLVPALNASKITPGQEFVFTLTYRNGCSTAFKNASIRIVFPAETDFISSSNPYFTRQGNVFDYNIGDLPLNAEATINMRGVAHATLHQDDALVFSAMINFLDNNAFQSLVAYLTIYVMSGSVAGTNGFAAISLSGLLSSPWFSLLLIILVLALLYRVSSTRRREKLQIA